MIREFDKMFSGLINESAPMVMLKSKEDRGGYVGKQDVYAKEKARSMSKSSTKNVYVVEFCEEY